MTRLWIDIDNPPQVQYLAPLAERWQGTDSSVFISARDNSITHELLRARGTPFVGVGHAFGKQRLRKVLGVLLRAIALMRAVRAFRPEMLVCDSRSGALAARLLRIPGMVIVDYEFAELTSYTKLGTHVAHPDAIPDSVFEEFGFDSSRLHAFPGLKEDLSFDGLDLSKVVPFQVPEHTEGTPVVAFRPPASETHYYSRDSAGVYLETLSYLANRRDLTTVFLPRYDWQVEQARELHWSGSLHVPDSPIPPLSLLAGSDLVISSGGTMLREAAYFGIPAYSIFQSRIGAVDRALEGRGLLKFVRDVDDLQAIEFRVRTDRILRRTTQAPTMNVLLSVIRDIASQGRKR